MECNIDLIRDILLRLEGRQPRESWLDLAINGYEQEMIGSHVELLKSAGFLAGAGGPTSAGLDWNSLRLTPSGQEFLDMARNDTLWTTVKATFRQSDPNFSLERLKAELFSAAKDLFG